MRHLTSLAMRTFSALNRKGSSLVMAVQVRPNSKANNVLEVSQEFIKIGIKAPPADGEANAQLIAYLAEIFSVDEGDIEIKRGESSRAKLISIKNTSQTDDEILDILTHLAK